MKRHWFLLATIALAFVVVGCGDKQPTAPTVPTGAALAMDPSVLPAPRPALDAAPDLSGASLVINDETLAKSNADGVPTAVTDSLAGLKGREFTNAAEFIAAVKGAAGPAADPHMETILRNSLVMRPADAVAAPEGQQSIADRETVQAASSGSGSGGNYGVIYFDYDKSNIKPEFEAVISLNAETLLANEDKVTIEGHADERGTNEYNLALGQRRAEAVRKALIAAGVPASQLSTVSFGEERPVDMGHDESAWSKNRRSELSAN